MGETLIITVQLNDALKKSIADLSAASGLSINAIAQDALEHYIDWHSEQIHDLQAGIAASDRGEFASESEVNALYARYSA